MDDEKGAAELAVQGKECPSRDAPTSSKESSGRNADSPPQKASSPQENARYDPGYSPVAAGALGQYFQGDDEFNQTNDNSMDGMFEDSNGYGEEIVRWMEDQRRLQQQSLANDDGREEQSGLMPTEPTNDALSAGNEGGSLGAAKVPETSSKRPASAVSNLSSSLQIPAKRRQRSQSTSQSPPDSRTPSRKRMDHALNERTRSQMALRNALLALERAKAVVRGCRCRYNAAKAVVENTAKEECDALLREDTQWNDLFRRLKSYKEETGDCNVKQNVSRDIGAEDGKNSPETVRQLARLSAFVGKNRKDGKQRKRSAAVRVSGICKATKPTADGKSSEESDRASHGDDGSDNDDLSVFDDVDPDSIHADPYKRVALDTIGFDWDPRNSRWNSMYEELRRYKEEHGEQLLT